MARIYMFSISVHAYLKTYIYDHQCKKILHVLTPTYIYLHLDFQLRRLLVSISGFMQLGIASTIMGLWCIHFIHWHFSRCPSTSYRRPWASLTFFFKCSSFKQHDMAVASFYMYSFKMQLAASRRAWANLDEHTGLALHPVEQHLIDQKRHGIDYAVHRQ